jgi:hypothetical protein
MLTASRATHYCCDIVATVAVASCKGLISLSLSKDGQPRRGADMHQARGTHAGIARGLCQFASQIAIAPHTVPPRRFPRRVGPFSIAKPPSIPVWACGYSKVGTGTRNENRWDYRPGSESHFCSWFLYRADGTEPSSFADILLYTEDLRLTHVGPLFCRERAIGVKWAGIGPRVESRRKIPHLCVKGATHGG